MVLDGNLTSLPRDERRVRAKSRTEDIRIIWKSIGHGDIFTLSNYEVDLAGHQSFIVYSGDLRIRLRLLDEDESSVQGSCILQINSHVDEEASYCVEKEVLAVAADFDDKKAGVRLSRDQGGKMTRCQLEGYLGLTACLEAVK